MSWKVSLAAFALTAAALIWIVAARTFGGTPTISIGVLSCRPWAGKGPSSMVWLGLTNTGHIAIICNRLNVDGKGWVQVESKDGWTTHGIGPGAVFGVHPEVLRPGSNTTACLELPGGALHWRVGYKVRIPSLRERVNDQLSPQWRVRLYPLTWRLSDKEGPGYEIRSSLFEGPHDAPPAADATNAVGRSIEGPWPPIPEPELR